MRVFKCGPDFLDPMILARASGAPVYQLDLWMVGEDECRRLLGQAAQEADLILIEGVMGLFDGQPSAADLARRFGVPVLGVIDAGAMAQTFAALAYGLAHFQADLPFAGVLANRTGSERHNGILQASLPPSIRWFGGLPRSAALELPRRHLGLIQAEELADLDTRLDAAADALLASAGEVLPEPVSFAAADDSYIEPLLAGVRIGVARDTSFAFLYQANLDLLRALGAELRFFSRWPMRPAGRRQPLPARRLPRAAPAGAGRQPTDAAGHLCDHPTPASRSSPNAAVCSTCSRSDRQTGRQRRAARPAAGQRAPAATPGCAGPAAGGAAGREPCAGILTTIPCWTAPWRRWPGAFARMASRWPRRCIAWGA